MSKRRISKASKRRLSVFGTFFVFVIIYFFFSVAYNIYIIYDLSKQKEFLEKSYIALKEESENLKNEIEKLKDEEYLADYARENYLYSKEGEYIIQIGELEEIDNNVDNIQNKITENYFMIFLWALIILILIYIFTKDKKTNEKKKRNGK